MKQKEKTKVEEKEAVVDEAEQETVEAETAEEKTAKEADAEEVKEEEVPKSDKKAQEINDKLMRTIAEFDNFRKRSEKDRRQVFVTMNLEKAEIYERQHDKILKFVDTLLEKIGKEKAEEIVQLFTLISNKAKEVMDL